MIPFSELSRFDPDLPETMPNDRVSALEEAVPVLRDARMGGDEVGIFDAKKDLIAKVIREFSDSGRIGRGRRYIVFAVGDCYLKVLISSGTYSPFPMTSTELVSLAMRHRLEHSAICNYFGDQVPDTLFYPRPGEFLDPELIVKDLNRPYPLIIQEGVLNASAIAEASKGPIAEMANFRQSLERLLGSFISMKDDLGFVPDIPDLVEPNVLVTDDGSICIVDTNTLVRPNEYHRFGFNFVEQIEALIGQIEKGHVEGNPQG